jgi:hypothetical protein
MSRTKRHKAFISYHHGLDEGWKDRFVWKMGDRIIDKSIYVGEIVDTTSPTADTLRRIREEYISEATVAVVLVGPRTWQRKFVDWEIGATLRDTTMNPRCGLIGILLPTHPDFGKSTYNPRLLPPRLADNCSGDHPFAKIVDWRGRGGADDIQAHIHTAFLRRRKQPDPDNSRLPFGRNWNGPPNEGWQS